MKKTSIIILILIIILIAWLAMNRKQKPVETSNDITTNQNQGNASTNNGQTPDEGNTIVGVLKVSDNKSRGNLMIVTDSTTVYLNTSRDFSSLLDQTIVATIDGDLNNFTLVDIKPIGQQ